MYVFNIKSVNIGENNYPTPINVVLYKMYEKIFIKSLTCPMSIRGCDHCVLHNSIPKMWREHVYCL